MSANIRKGKGSVSFRINFKDPVTGIWRGIEKGGFKTVKEAQIARAAKLLELTANPETVLVKDKAISLQEVYTDFITKYAQYDREKSTIKRYASLFRNHLEPKWGSRQMSTIQANELSEYLFSLTATNEYEYIKSIRNFMGVLWRFAEQQKFMRVNSFRNVVMPKADSTDKFTEKVYTEAQLDMFEQRFATTHSITAFRIARATGVRCGECYGLLWSDIDLEQHTMSISKQMVYEDKMWTLRNAKTKSAIRVIDLPDDLCHYLQEVRETQLRQKAELGVAYKVNRIAVDMGRNKPKEIREDLELVNLKSNGELLTPDSEKFLGRISRKELSVNFKFHNLRHTHASWLAEHNVPAIVAKKRLGHSKEETTLKYYQHITQGMRADLLEKLNGTAV